VGTTPDRILQGASDLLENQEVYQRMAMAINPFGDGQAAARIVSIIEQYLADRSH